MNVEEILKFQKPKESFYDILGCDISSSIDQINREYKIRALQYHPDKNPDPKSLEQFKRLQLAKEILVDEKSRKTYDTWLTSGLSIPFEQFKARKAQHSMHWATPRSANLSIKNVESKGQGSDVILKQNSMKTNINCNLSHYNCSKNLVDTFRLSNDQADQQDSRADWLGKFRRYEV